MGLFSRKSKSISRKTKTAHYLECLYFGPALMDVAYPDKDKNRSLKWVGSMREPPRDETGRVKAGEWISDSRLPINEDTDLDSIRVVPFPNDYIGVFGIRTYTWEEEE